VEPCPICLGDEPGEHLRALDAILADLASVGFDADWTVVPASGVGAAHKRERWFCAAYPAGQPWSFEHGDSGERGEELLLKGVARAAADGSLLPTPTAMDSRGSGGNPDTTGTHGTTLTDATVRQPARWGEYEPAIRRWEALTRPAPEPTKLNAKGNPKLSDEFDEWLMGFPAGWITDVPGVTWNEVLRACGNGVVWQQGAAALRFLLDMGRAA
jgi:DNA (cytosine-5)-methyltransferase 1